MVKRRRVNEGKNQRESESIAKGEIRRRIRKARRGEKEQRRERRTGSKREGEEPVRGGREKRKGNIGKQKE